MSKCIFNGNKRLKVHNRDSIITTFNSDTNEHEWFYYNNKDMWIDSFQLNTIEFENKYSERLINFKYQMLDSPKILLCAYHPEEYYSDSVELFITDSLEKVLISNYKWGCRRADIILITKEIII